MQSDVLETESVANPFDTLSEAEKEGFTIAMARAQGFANIAKHKGSTGYSMYLEERIRRLMGDKDRANDMRVLIAACGDPRVLSSPWAFNDPVNAKSARVGLMLNALNGGAEACGGGYGKPRFDNKWKNDWRLKE